MKAVGGVETGGGENVVDQHALPRVSNFDHLVTQWMSRVMLRLRQRVEFRPVPSHDRLRADLEREAPVLDANVRRRTGRQHRKVIGQRLTRRQPFGDVRRLLSSGEAACDHLSPVRLSCQVPRIR